MNEMKDKFREKETEEFVSILKKYREKISKTEKSSAKFLKDLGVITEKGNLTSNYRNICIPEVQE